MAERNLRKGPSCCNGTVTVVAHTLTVLSRMRTIQIIGGCCYFAAKLYVITGRAVSLPLPDGTINVDGTIMWLGNLN